MEYQCTLLWSIAVLFLSCSLSLGGKIKWQAPSPILHQEHLLRNLAEYDIGYPTQVNHEGRYLRHVTSSDHHRRMRRSTDDNDGPIYYSIKYRGKKYKLRLKKNDQLMGSDFVVEKHKKGGKVERTKVVQHCYLIGETTGSRLSAAISDCDGLSGVFDTGDDMIFIEPIINETFVGKRNKGRPHLMYRKSQLNKIEVFALDMSGDEWKPSYASAQTEPKKTFTLQAAQSFIKIINQADRPVKVLYLEDDEEKLFSVFTFKDEQSINTFTSHRWLARDSLSDKRLFIGGKKLFAPFPNHKNDRATISITIPKGLSLPFVAKPDPPNSHLNVINRSGRFVELTYTNGGEPIAFRVVQPGGTMKITSYTSHRWYASDYDTGKSLWLNKRFKFIPILSDRDNRITVIVTVPPGLILPKEGTFGSLFNTPTRYVEVMATADASVVDYHGKDNVERFVLTLMNIVARVFQHKSIGVRIEIVVVRLMILEEDPKDIEITTVASESLAKVCKWGDKVRKGFDKTESEFHDLTMFLTRNDFGPAGFAPVGSMCVRSRSCSLNRDDGFPSAFILAHETGHTLGMEHDGTLNNCTRDQVKGSIMAPIVYSRFDQFYWSECSKRALIASLDHLWCIEDVPFNSNRSIMNKLPGQIYNLDEQCEMDFGDRYSNCEMPYLPNPCLKLWCDDKSFGSYCRTRGTALLEGTLCGKMKWCRLGKCVAVTKDGSFEIPTPKPTPKPIDGGWSNWSGFGRCSLSCSQGVKLRARTCTEPRPQHSGSPCKDSSINMEFCNLKSCAGIPPSFKQIRIDECQRRGSKKKWSYYEIYSVNLDCDFEDGLCGWTQDPSDDFDWTVNQGKTPSSKTGPKYDHTKGLEGKGTYLFMETSRPTDVNWRARLVSKLIAKQVSCLSFWYHSFGDDEHFGTLELLLNTTVKEKVIWGHSGDRGNRWIHKHVTIFSIMPYRVVFQGTRGDGYRADIAIDDVVFIDGPCKLGIVPPIEENKIPVSLCHTYCESNKLNSIIKIPIKDGHRCHENPGVFDVCLKGKCKKVGCDDKIGSHKVYDNCGLCDGNNDTCVIKKGTIHLNSDQYEEVVLECPVGSTNIMVQEMRESNDFFVVQSAGLVNQTFINGGSTLSPSGIYEMSGAKFVYSRDNNTEKLLALGPLKEKVVVKVKKDKKNIDIPNFVRFQFYKPKKEPETYIWKPIGWENCTKPCGGGIQNRLYDCYRKKDLKKMNLKFCTGVTKQKPTSKPCNAAACKISFNWTVSKWGPCSVTCSNGMRMRKVYCERSTYGEKTRYAIRSNCGAGKPKVSEKCSKKECIAKWVAGPWGQCSRTCGRGLRTRSVKCLNREGKPSWQCTDETKLQITGYCTQIKCISDVPVLLGNLSCTFEVGFCRWRNTRKGDNFDWQLRSGPTPSRYTGPDYDHTFRSRKGKYIFTEASAPQDLGHKAKLFSPLIRISKLCLDFWFNMLGEKMGSLNVYLRTVKGDAKLWFKKGNQGGRWNNVRLQITSSVAYRIIIEGVRGNGFSGDSAIDDITIYTGKCPATKYIASECFGDTSRYCSLAVRFKWCSSIAWGERLCCDSCAKYKEVKYRRRQRRN